MALSPLQNVVNNAKKTTTNLQNAYNNSTNVKTANSMMNSTVDGISKKYGFDFSRDYASQQAETEAQAKRNTYNNSIRQNTSTNQTTMKQIQDNLSQGNAALDNSFFQTYLQQRQAQANRGINSGISAEQDLRLGMNQQAQMASMYRDAATARTAEQNRFGNESLRLKEALGLVEQERAARENALYQELVQRAYDTISQERSYGLELSQSEWNKLQDQISRELNISQMDAERIMNEAELTGKYNGSRTAEQYDREFQQRMNQANLKLDQDQFSWQKQMDQADLALRQAAAARAASGGSSSSSSSSKKTTSTKAAPKATNLVNQFKAQQTSSAKSNITKYYENQNSKLTNSVVRKPVTLPGTRVTPATDKSLSAWSKMKMFGG